MFAAYILAMRRKLSMSQYSIAMMGFESASVTEKCNFLPCPIFALWQFLPYALSFSPYGDSGDLVSPRHFNAPSWREHMQPITLNLHLTYNVFSNLSAVTEVRLPVLIIAVVGSTVVGGHSAVVFFEMFPPRQPASERLFLWKLRLLYPFYRK